LSPLTDFGAKMNSDFGIEMSRIKVTVELNMPHNALFGLVVVTYWGRHRA